MTSERGHAADEDSTPSIAEEPREMDGAEPEQVDPEEVDPESGTDSEGAPVDNPSG